MRVIIVCIFSTVILFLNATMRIVAIDGSGQFLSIQEGITAAVNGDTVMVYPSIYFENINYNGKNITIASLELITGNPAYRDSTIIDGNNNGSCVRVNSHETNAEIYGFTIQHGSGYSYMIYGAMVTEGGGIRVANEANFRISNCSITNNKATNGGGIAIERGTATIKGTIITNNLASNVGGGIVVLGDINFDSINRCSVYENYAGWINDISLSTNNVVNVYLNTATVNPPTEYYIKYVKIMPSSPNNLGIMDILQGCRTEVNHDLYVTPDGNDENDGLSFLNPKRSIALALHTISSDSLNPKTLYIAAGIYSSEAGQLFPLNLKAYVRIMGDSISTPILLNQAYETTIMGCFANNMTVSNLIIDHGDYHPIQVFFVSFSDNCRISNITINPVTAYTFAGLLVLSSRCDLNNIRLNGLTSVECSGLAYTGLYGRIRNCSINDCHNTGGENNLMYSIFDAEYDSLLVIENVSVTNSTDSFAEAPIFAISSYYAQNSTLVMSNVLVTNNTTSAGTPINIDNIHENTALISNCTFANNHSAAYAVNFFGRMNISNCIFDNYAPREMSLGWTANNISHIVMSNNLISGYPNSVFSHDGNDVTFNEFNITANPQFAGTDITNLLSYRLGANSPCIDAGTPDTTGLYLPEFDLSGNPRIYNDTIDIGCYEWNGTGAQDVILPQPEAGLSIKVSPNPFKIDTYLSFNLPVKGSVSITIYNIKGQKIRNLVNGNLAHGTNRFYWDGKDDQGHSSCSGLYFATLTFNNKQTTRKMILIK